LILEGFNTETGRWRFNDDDFCSLSNVDWTSVSTDWTKRGILEEGIGLHTDHATLHWWRHVRT